MPGPQVLKTVDGEYYYTAQLEKNTSAQKRQCTFPCMLAWKTEEIESRGSQLEAIYPQRNTWQYQIHFGLCLLVWRGKEKTQWHLGCKSQGR